MDLHFNRHLWIELHGNKIVIYRSNTERTIYLSHTTYASRRRLQRILYEMKLADMDIDGHTYWILPTAKWNM